MNLNKTINWINKTEGRDKFCKSIQYFSRFVKWGLQDKNKELADRFNGLFTSMRDARKLFRLFKSLNEYHKILSFITKKEGDDEVELGLNIANRVAFLLYWFFDNLNILSTIKFMRRDPKPYAKLGSTFWFIALIAQLIQSIRQFFISMEEEKRIRKGLNTAESTERDLLKERLKKMHAGRKDIYLTIAKTLGDMVPAAAGAELPQKILKKTFNDGFIGIGGLISAVITSYQLY